MLHQIVTLFRRTALLLCLVSVASSSGVAMAERPVVIAHRGASGYLPEHTLAAKALAYGMGADYLEQDVVLSKDDIPFVLHDIHIDSVTNVASVFPERARTDGRYYALDFSAAELKRLSVHERTTKSGVAAFPLRFPVGRSQFGMNTLSEEIEMIQGMNRASGKDVGVYVEIKQPKWHRDQHHDVTKIVLGILERYGYNAPGSRVFVQCFEWPEIRRIRMDLGSTLPLVYLVSASEIILDSAGAYRLKSADVSLRDVAKVANGIGPNYAALRDGGYGPAGKWNGLVPEAHALGLVVHPYTLRADQLPRGVDDFHRLVQELISEGKVDGFFTDHPDLAIEARDTPR